MRLRESTLLFLIAFLSLSGGSISCCFSDVFMGPLLCVRASEVLSVDLVVRVMFVLVMSAARPFVNCIDRIIFKKCIRKTLNLTLLPCTNLY